MLLVLGVRTRMLLCSVGPLVTPLDKDSQPLESTESLDAEEVVQPDCARGQLKTKRKDGAVELSNPEGNWH